jgi:hypothetical protein
MQVLFGFVANFVGYIVFAGVEIVADYTKTEPSLLQFCFTFSDLEFTGYAVIFATPLEEGKVAGKMACVCLLSQLVVPDFGTKLLPLVYEKCFPGGAVIDPSLLDRLAERLTVMLDEETAASSGNLLLETQAVLQRNVELNMICFAEEKFPILAIDLIRVIEVVGSAQIAYLLGLLLLERSVLVIHREVGVASAAVLVLKELLNPFKWDGLLFSILPVPFYDLLFSNSRPCLAGIGAVAPSDIPFCHTDPMPPVTVLNLNNGIIYNAPKNFEVLPDAALFQLAQALEIFRDEVDPRTHVLALESGTANLVSLMMLDPEDMISSVQGSTNVDSKSFYLKAKQFGDFVPASVKVWADVRLKVDQVDVTFRTWQLLQQNYSGFRISRSKVGWHMLQPEERLFCSFRAYFAWWLWKYLEYADSDGSFHTAEFLAEVVQDMHAFSSAFVETRIFKKLRLARLDRQVCLFNTYLTEGVYDSLKESEDLLQGLRGYVFYAYKLGRIIKNWKFRVFLLTENSLVYYQIESKEMQSKIDAGVQLTSRDIRNHMSDFKKKGEVVISPVHTVIAVKPPEVKNETLLGDHDICISSDDRVLQLKLSTGESRRIVLRLLKSILFPAREMREKIRILSSHSLRKMRVDSPNSVMQAFNIESHGLKVSHSLLDFIGSEFNNLNQLQNASVESASVTMSAFRSRLLSLISMMGWVDPNIAASSTLSFLDLLRRKSEEINEEEKEAQKRAQLEAQLQEGMPEGHNASQQAIEVQDGRNANGGEEQKESFRLNEETENILLSCKFSPFFVEAHPLYLAHVLQSLQQVLAASPKLYAGLVDCVPTCTQTWLSYCNPRKYGVDVCREAFGLMIKVVQAPEGCSEEVLAPFLEPEAFAAMFSIIPEVGEGESSIFVGARLEILYGNLFKFLTLLIEKDRSFSEVISNVLFMKSGEEVLRWLCAALKCALRTNKEVETSLLWVPLSGFLAHLSEFAEVRSRILELGGPIVVKNLINHVKSNRLNIMRVIGIQGLKIRRKLGAGAFGQVYLLTAADEQAFDHAGRCAAKVFFEEGLTFSWEDFRNELSVLSLLYHPHISPLYGVSVESQDLSTLEWDENTEESERVPNELLPFGPILFFAMFELGDLRSYLDRQSTLTSEQVSQFVRQLASALEYLHSLGLIHRDIKSVNVFVQDEMHVALGDFGLTSHISTVSDGVIEGTVRWMPPESIASPETASFPSDIYSLAITFFEIFTAELPFGETPHASLYEVIIDGVRPSAKSIRWKNVASKWQELCQDMWEAEPAKRPSASHVLARIDKIMHTISPSDSLSPAQA